MLLAVPSAFTAVTGRAHWEVLVRARGLGVPRPGLGIDVGNPHIVVALSGTEELEALDLAAQPQKEVR